MQEPYKVTSNDACPCASGKKYKLCCRTRTPAKRDEFFLIPQKIQEALQLQQSGNFAQSEALYLQVLQLNPNYPDALHFLGTCRHAQGDSASGIKLIQQAINIKPISSMFGNLGVLLQSHGQLDRAIAAYRQAIALAPTDDTSKNNLNQALRENETRTALISYQKSYSSSASLLQLHDKHAINATHDALSVAVHEQVDYAFYPTVPAISLELTNLCNLKCPYCANPTLTRPKKYIEWDLLEKIVDECAQQKFNLAWLHGVGEPLLWDRLEEAVTLIRSKDAGDGSFGTNGTLLTPERVRKLLDAGLNSIYVSIDTLDPDIYKATRGGNLDKVVRNIKDMIGLVPDSFQVTVALMNHKEHILTAKSIEKFHEVFGTHANVRTNLVQNMLFPSAPGDYRVDQGQKQQSCFSPANYFFIALDGRAAICCIDQDVLHSLGSVAERSIHDVWFDKQNQTTFRNVALGTHQCPSTCTKKCVLREPTINLKQTSVGYGLSVGDALTLADTLVRNGQELVAATITRDLARRDPTGAITKGHKTTASPV